MNRPKAILSILFAVALVSLTSCGKGSKSETKETKVSAADNADKMELVIELPRPLFIGTPKPIKLPSGLKLDEGGKRAPFFVPKGTTNLAKAKPVTSSDMPIFGELELITDGDKDAPDGCSVELAPGLQWVQIDLGKSAEISAIVAWHFLQERVYHDVIAQVSDDAEFKTGVTTLFNNDHDNTQGMGAGKDPAYVDNFQGWLIDGKGTNGQYVRLYSAGNTASDLNHYIEVEVYGK